MPLNSEYIEAIIKAVMTAFQKQSEIQSKDTDVEKLAPFVTKMICTSADLLLAVRKNGGNISPAAAGTFIVTRVAGFAGLSDNDKVQCFGAVLGLVTSAADFVGVVGATGASEVASGGVATPAVTAISIPMLISTSAALVLSASDAHQQCGPLVSQFFNDRQTELQKVYIDFNAYVGNPAL